MRVVAVGRFDGVHLGHRRLLSVGRRIAEERGLSLCAYTFPPRGEALLPLEAKAALLREMADEVIVRPWEEIRGLSPREFVERELVARLGTKAVVLGPDHRFGRGAAGDATLLEGLGGELGLLVKVVPPLTRGGAPVSSRRIRALVREGRVEEAAELLGRPHVFFGKRVKGVQLARRLGYPTVNLEPLPSLVRPRAGVYLAWSHWKGGNGPGLFYIGSRPTFPHLPAVVEIHLFSPPRGEPEGVVEVALVRFLRPEAAFHSPEELATAIEGDMRRAKRMLAGLRAPRPLVVGRDGRH